MTYRAVVVAHVATVTGYRSRHPQMIPGNGIFAPIRRAPNLSPVGIGAGFPAKAETKTSTIRHQKMTFIKISQRRNGTRNWKWNGFSRPK